MIIKGVFKQIAILYFLSPPCYGEEGGGKAPMWQMENKQVVVLVGFDLSTGRVTWITNWVGRTPPKKIPNRLCSKADVAGLFCPILSISYCPVYMGLGAPSTSISFSSEWDKSPSRFNGEEKKKRRGVICFRTSIMILPFHHIMCSVWRWGFVFPFCLTYYIKIRSFFCYRLINLTRLQQGVSGYIHKLHTATAASLSGDAVPRLH